MAGIPLINKILAQYGQSYHLQKKDITDKLMIDGIKLIEEINNRGCMKTVLGGAAFDDPQNPHHTLSVRKGFLFYMEEREGIGVSLCSRTGCRSRPEKYMYACESDVEVVPNSDELEQDLPSMGETCIESQENEKHANHTDECGDEVGPSCFFPATLSGLGICPPSGHRTVNYNLSDEDNGESSFSVGNQGGCMKSEPCDGFNHLPEIEDDNPFEFCVRDYFLVDDKLANANSNVPDQVPEALDDQNPVPLKKRKRVRRELV